MRSMTYTILLGYGLSAASTPIPGRTASVPSYVFDYAPLVYLHSEDTYRPSDIGAQLLHTQPEVDYTVIPGHYNLSNLDTLNLFGGSDVYLRSKIDVTTNPDWFRGVEPDAHGKIGSAVACAVITTDIEEGTVDVFYMYFYAYNWAVPVAGVPSWNVGNHVGDWEHNMIRFENGVPTAMWFSQHANGQAFEWKAVQKCGNRPVAYSANGSHANYAVSGEHEHTIPNWNLPINGLIMDFTDDGPLWDPVSSAFFYSFNKTSATFTPYHTSFPTAWLNFTGHWGDKQYPESDPREANNIFYAIEPRHADGPTGPIHKELNRTNVCPNNGYRCIIRKSFVA